MKNKIEFNSQKNIFLLEDNDTGKKFPVDSAGRIMTKKIPIVLFSSTIGQIQDILSNKKK